MHLYFPLNHVIGSGMTYKHSELYYKDDLMQPNILIKYSLYKGSVPILDVPSFPALVAVLGTAL